MVKYTQDWLSRITGSVGVTPWDKFLWSVNAGAAFELMHAFALFHDDVMDGSDTRRGLPSAHRRFAFGELELDADAHAARIGERTVDLTRTEYQLLELLMLNPRRVLPHSMIYDRVWGYDFGPTSNALRVYVGYLRRKLEDAGAQVRVGCEWLDGVDDQLLTDRVRVLGTHNGFGLAVGVAALLAVNPSNERMLALRPALPESAR